MQCLCAFASSCNLIPASRWLYIFDAHFRSPDADAARSSTRRLLTSNTTATATAAAAGTAGTACTAGNAATTVTACASAMLLFPQLELFSFYASFVAAATAIAAVAAAAAAGAGAPPLSAPPRGLLAHSQQGCGPFPAMTAAAALVSHSAQQQQV